MVELDKLDIFLFRIMSLLIDAIDGCYSLEIAGC